MTSQPIDLEEVKTQVSKQMGPGRMGPRGAPDSARGLGQLDAGAGLDRQLDAAGARGRSQYHIFAKLGGRGPLI